MELRLVAPAEEDLRLAEAVAEDLRFAVGCGAGSDAGDATSGEGVSGNTSACSFCFVVVLVAVLPRAASFEVLAVVLAFEADLVVVSGSTASCGVG